MQSSATAAQTPLCVCLQRSTEAFLSGSQTWEGMKAELLVGLSAQLTHSLHSAAHRSWRIHRRTIENLPKTLRPLLTSLQVFCLQPKPKLLRSPQLPILPASNVLTVRTNCIPTVQYIKALNVHYCSRDNKNNFPHLQQVRLWLTDVSLFVPFILAVHGA